MRNSKESQKINYLFGLCYMSSCVKVHGTPSNLLSSRSTLCAMFTMQHFFSMIPHETAVQRYAAQGERVATHDFCCGFVTTAGSAVLQLATEEAPAPAIPRRSGRPQGSLNVEIFIRGLVNKIVDAACATLAITKNKR